jgi:hypothetical protein
MDGWMDGLIDWRMRGGDRKCQKKTKKRSRILGWVLMFFLCVLRKEPHS